MPMRRRRIWLLASGSLLALIIATGSLAYGGKLPIPPSAYRIRLLQDWLPVRAPEWQVGDTWTYENSFGGVPYDADVMTINGPLQYRVTAVAGDRVNVAVTSSSGFTSFVWDKQGNLVENKDLDMSGGDLSRASKTFDPPLRWFDFPLRTGKTWQATSTANVEAFSNWYNGKDGAGSKQAPESATVIVRVLGWERDIGELDGVAVDGLKITTDVIDSNGKLVEKATEWYVPAAGRSVLQQIDYSYGYPNSATRRLSGFTPSDPTNATGKE